MHPLILAYKLGNRFDTIFPFRSCVATFNILCTFLIANSEVYYIVMLVNTFIRWLIHLYISVKCKVLFEFLLYKREHKFVYLNSVEDYNRITNIIVPWFTTVPWFTMIISATSYNLAFSSSGVSSVAVTALST